MSPHGIAPRSAWHSDRGVTQSRARAPPRRCGREEAPSGACIGNPVVFPYFRRRKSSLRSLLQKLGTACKPMRRFAKDRARDRNAQFEYINAQADALETSLT